MKRVTYILSVSALVAVIVLILIFNRKKRIEKTSLVSDVTEAVAVKLEAVSSTTYSAEFSSSGVLQAKRDLKFMSDAAGRVVAVYATEGSYVSKGKVVIQLEDELLSADLKASETAYNALKKDYERFKSSNEMNGISDQQLDNIRTQLIAAESRYTVSKRRLADASIKAPISGTVYRRYVETGSLVNPGAPLFDIIDDSELKVACYATEKQVLHLTKGQEVSVTGDTFPGETFTGKITVVGNKADRSFNFPVEITLTNPNKALKAGMYVHVLFNKNEEQSGILIPRSAVSGSVREAKAFVVENGTAKSRPIVCGDMQGERIEVLEGLQPGDTIVVAGLINVFDGAKVKDSAQ